MDFEGGLNIEVSCNILRRWNILCSMTWLVTMHGGFRCGWYIIMA